MENIRIGTHKDIDVLVENENIWLNVSAIAILFEIDQVLLST